MFSGLPMRELFGPSLSFCDHLDVLVCLLKAFHLANHFIKKRHIIKRIPKYNQQIKNLRSVLSIVTKGWITNKINLLLIVSSFVAARPLIYIMSKSC